MTHFYLTYLATYVDVIQFVAHVGSTTKYTTSYKKLVSQFLHRQISYHVCMAMFISTWHCSFLHDTGHLYMTHGIHLAPLALQDMVMEP